MTDSAILLYGGTFDPIHNGHLIIARAVAERLQLGHVVLIPSAHPPHKVNNQITAARHRYAMCAIAVNGDAFYTVSDCELKREGPSFTLETVRELQKAYSSDVRLYWLIGADTVHELDTWYKIEELVDACTLVTAVRPGYDCGDLSGLRSKLTASQIETIRSNILETPVIDISSTDIRERLQNGLSIRYLVPDRVVEYITIARLYE